MLLDQYLEYLKKNEVPVVCAWKGDYCEIEPWNDKDMATKTPVKVVDYDGEGFVLRNGSSETVIPRSRIKFLKTPFLS